MTLKMNAGKLDRWLNSREASLALVILQFLIGFSVVVSFFVSVDWWRKVKRWFDFMEGDPVVLTNLLFAECWITVAFVVTLIVAMIRYSKTTPENEKRIFQAAFGVIILADFGVNIAILSFTTNKGCQELWDLFDKEKYGFAGWEAYWERTTAGVADQEALMNVWKNRRCHLPSVLIMIAFIVKYTSGLIIALHKYLIGQAFSRGYNQLPLKERNTPPLNMGTGFEPVRLDNMPLEDLSSRK